MALTFVLTISYVTILPATGWPLPWSLLLLPVLFITSKVGRRHGFLATGVLLLGPALNLVTTNEVPTPAKIADLVAFLITAVGGSLVVDRLRRGVRAGRLAAESYRNNAVREARIARIGLTVPGIGFSLRMRPDGSTSFPSIASQVERLLGLKANDLLRDGEPFFNRIRVEDRLLVRRALASSADSAKEWKIEFRITRPLVNEIWIGCHAIPIREADGSTIWHGYFTDITSSKQAEETVRQNSDRLKLALTATQTGLWEWDVGSDTFVWSPESFQILTKEAFGQHLHSFAKYVHPDDAGAFHELLDRTIAGEAPDSIDIRIVRPNGEVRWLSLASYLDGKETGRHPRVIGTVQDITERKRSEIAVQDSEKRLATIVESATEGIILAGEDGTVALINRAAQAMFGRSEALVLGQPLQSLIPGFPRTAQSREELMVLEGLRSDGTAFPIEASIAPTELDDRPMVSIFIRDITKVHEAEEAARVSDERFQQLAENIREVFWLSATDHSRIFYVSPGYDEIWGQSREALYQSPMAWMEAVHPDDRDRVNGKLGQQIHGTYDEEYRITRPDGASRWIRDRAFPVRDKSGTIIRIAGIAEDITEHRTLETQLLQNQKMESIGRLAGGVAHDFNNWLTVIAGSCEFLTTADLSEAERREALDDIKRAVDRASSLTGQLLAFSRRKVLEPKVLDLNAIVWDTEKMLDRILGEDVLSETTLDPTISAIRSDPGHLVQVLMNLAVNARDAMPKGGTLRIETREVTIPPDRAAARREAPGTRYVVLAVTDNGIGMTEEEMSRAFEPFFTTKGPREGTGLGLAVVHGIVEQSGGFIELESTRGKGTTFRIYLPALPHEVTPPKATASPQLRGTETVLLVEDEDIVRKVAARGLEAQGYKVLEADGGHAALDLLAANEGEVDLMATDVVMPRMDGRELAEIVAKKYPAIRILYTSGYTDDAVVRYGVMRAEVAFLQKPYTAHTLVKKIREVLDGTDQPRPTVNG